MDDGTVKMILEGPLKGKDITLGQWQFVGGVCVLEGTLKSNEGAIKYLRRCYQARPEGGDLEENPQLATTRLVLHGALKGQTIKLGEFQFTNGVMVLEGPPESNVGVITYCDRNWQAKLESLEDVKDGKRDVQKDQGTAGPPEVLSDVGSDGGEPSEEATGDDSGSGDAEADEGSELQAEGDGEDLGFTEEQKELRGILADLDPDNDDHWTKRGSPKHALVKLRLGLDISSEEMSKAILDAWPGFSREYVRGTRGIEG